MKKVARELLVKLQEQLAVDQWQTKQQTRAAVQSTIRFALNELPEEPYPEPVWNEKVLVWPVLKAIRKPRPRWLFQRWTRPSSAVGYR